MDKELTIITEPEELIAWADTFNILLNPSIEDAAILLNYMEGHDYAIGISFVDGKKYRYEKGDWAKYSQPITNKLCQEYGLSIIDVEDGSKEKQHENYKDWSEYREGSKRNKKDRLSAVGV